MKIKNILLTPLCNFWSILPRFLCYRIHIISTCRETIKTVLRALWREDDDNKSLQVPLIFSLQKRNCLKFTYGREFEASFQNHLSTTNRPATSPCKTGSYTMHKGWNSGRGCEARKGAKGNQSKFNQNWTSLDLDLHADSVAVHHDHFLDLCKILTKPQDSNISPTHLLCTEINNIGLAMQRSSWVHVPVLQEKYKHKYHSTLTVLLGILKIYWC